MNEFYQKYLNPKICKITHLSIRYQIGKYPTLKLLLNAKTLKNEYRGERTEKAIVEYVRDLMRDPVIHIVFNDLTNFMSLVYEHSSIIGHYKDPPQIHKKYDMFLRVAADLKSYCKFYWVTNSPSLPQGKDELIAFKSAKKSEQSEYESVFQNYDELSTWSIGNCIPIVREINFENAEEIIEEGLPLVIPFRNLKDQESVDLFKSTILKELIKETSNVNFVTADGGLFEHPLQHLGKTKKDLPLIAIDSFKHMYLFPFFEDLKQVLNSQQIF
jgi:endoplasmic reticulum resident protein 44